MNLEQRVQALEQEVELLKAQIQATLLDIQEQLLNNTYPALRAEQSSPQAAPMPEVHTPPPAVGMPVKRITLTETEPDDDPDLEEEIRVVPTVRKRIQLEEPTQPSIPEWNEHPERQIRSERHEYPERIERAQPPVAHQRPDAGTPDWSELEDWVSQKVEKMGIERTRELIDLYGREERFTRQERLLLMQFVDIYDDGEEKPNPAPRRNSKHKQEPEHPTIVPQTRAVVEEIRTELRQKQARSNGRQQMPEELSEQQGLVLRLIAGILSAGDETTPPSANGNGRRKY